jgi:hypothetical protein
MLIIPISKESNTEFLEIKYWDRVTAVWKDGSGVYRVENGSLCDDIKHMDYKH